MKRLFLLKLLMIEDSTIARKSIREGLRNYNFEIVEAQDGHNGIRLAESAQPDVITLDLNLPDMHGFEILNKLRSNTKTADIPVIITTTSSQTADVEKSMKAGAQYYLVKPVDIGKLLNRITKILSITEEEISTLFFKKDVQDASSNEREINKTISYQKTEVKSLKENMVIGLPVNLSDGSIIVKSGTVLDDETIRKIQKSGLEFVYIKK